MDEDELKERMARKMYECRHPSHLFPSWEDLLTVKTYKPRKYRELAGAALAALRASGFTI